MAIVASSFDRIKRELNRYLPQDYVESACRDAGHRWRERKLGPVLTLQLFVLQILNGNTAIRHLRHLAKMPIKAASYCKARMRLPLVVLQELLRHSSAAMRQALAQEAPAAAQWLGHRTFLVDGSSTIVPDTPQLQKVFKQPKGQKKGCGLPVPKVLGLFDACTGLIVEVMAFALYVHEQSKVWLLHPLLGAGDLLVADRGFCSFVHVALLSARQAWCFGCTRGRSSTSARTESASGSATKRIARVVPLAVDQAPGQARSTGQVDQAQEQTQVDGPRAIRRSAGGIARARAAVFGERQGLALARGDDRDDAD